MAIPVIYGQGASGRGYLGLFDTTLAGYIYVWVDNGAVFFDIVIPNSGSISLPPAGQPPLFFGMAASGEGVVGTWDSTLSQYQYIYTDFNPLTPPGQLQVSNIGPAPTGTVFPNVTLPSGLPAIFIGANGNAGFVAEWDTTTNSYLFAYGDFAVIGGQPTPQVQISDQGPQPGASLPPPNLNPPVAIPALSSTQIGIEGPQQTQIMKYIPSMYDTSRPGPGKATVVAGILSAFGHFTEILGGGGNE